MIVNDSNFRALLRKGWDPVIIADRLALGLARARFRLALPLARAASRFMDGKDWLTFGYARLEDHARERFGRSSRWVRDLRALDEATIRCPGLAAALTGEDGGTPLGTVAALLVGRVATPDNVSEWIDLARRLTVRELRERVRIALASSSACSPSDEEDASASADESLFDESRLSLRFAVPPPVGVAVEEAHDLHRAVCGGETSTSEFVEALIAESLAGPVAPLVNEGWIGARPSPTVREIALERKAEGWTFLRDVRLDGEELCEAVQTLQDVARRCREVERAAGSADSAIRALIDLENEIELRLGDLLALMGESGAWRGLRFSGVGHYAEERLGMSRSVAQGRSHLSRVLRQHEALRGACQDGRVGFEAASLVARVLGSGGDSTDGQSAWIERAEESTIKRLREELRFIERERALRSPRSVTPTGPIDAIDPIDPIGPMDDATWQRSRTRYAGQTRERLELLTAAACEDPVASLVIRFRLPVELASALLSAVRAERQRLEEMCQTMEGEQSLDGGLPALGQSVPGSVRAALMFSKRFAGVPEWCALLSLVEGFVSTWDDPGQSPRRPADKIYVRDGYRCSAPGCSSRRNLEEHHIVYRSRGGDDTLSNRVTLCRFHHQQGEHSGLMRCRGKAPLHITWWMGRHGAGGTFRNERRLNIADASAARSA